jgi:exopolyphosphatase/guanosine-5'-triphosphate,3'-diphosphate pyrophosphatase
MCPATRKGGGRGSGRLGDQQRERAGTPPHSAAPGRLAAIDIGSNSIHMLVVERGSTGTGGYRVLARERDMVRLGKSALGDGALSGKAMRKGLEALLKMTTLARLKGASEIVAVATSAVREAANGGEFLAQVRALTGLAVRLLSGEEEGRLIFRAVRHAVDLSRDTVVLADVGGGSTEWCVARKGELRSVQSVRLGSLRCAALIEGDPPLPRSVERLRRAIREELARLKTPKRVDRLVATSGTAACCGDLADLAAGRERGAMIGGLRELRLRELDGVVSGLRTMTVAEIAALPAVGAPRAASILAGAVLLQELAARAAVDRLFLCDRALREGLVLEALGAPAGEEPAGAEVRRRQVLDLASRAPGMLVHAQQVARLAIRLFDLAAPVHNLGAREREWLEFAALLHDIGHSIHFERHHKHSHYLITTADLDGFDPREIEIIAEVARYHRGAPPREKHPSFAALRPWQQRTIEKLTALLRVANALDCTHATRVVELHASLKGRRSMGVEVLSPFEVDLELESARQRAILFERVFGRRLTFRQGLKKPSRRR